MSLKALEARILHELSFTEYPARSWVVPKVLPDRQVHDVVIVGGGQSGLAAAFGLMRESVTRLLVLDRNQPGDEGPWLSFARMKTLRTPKQGSGLDFGNPSLTPQAWFEAQHGAEAWARLGKMPREMWQDYLRWYRTVLNIPVRNGVWVTSITPCAASPDLLEVNTQDHGTFVARRVVLATGLDGSGRWYVPEVAKDLPSQVWGHTETEIDFSKLAGRRVGVLGGGASAFDNAATALEAGASKVDLCIRIPKFPSVNPYRWLEFSGFLSAYCELPDEKRWRFMRQVARMNQPPPQETMWRCTRHANFSLHTDAQWNRIEQTPEGLKVTMPHQTLTFDFLIFATGISNDLTRRPELQSLAPWVALWKDRFQPSPGEEDDSMSRAPYLGPGFEFWQKVPGTAAWVERVHNYNYGATLSMGLSAASITGMKYGIRRLIDGVVKGLFQEDEQALFEQLVNYNELEIVHHLPPELREHRTDLMAVGASMTSNAGSTA